jgi:hypothetical protein
MPTTPASPGPVAPAHGELEALAAAAAVATARARRGELDTLPDLADRIERLCAGLAADGDIDRLRPQLVGLADEVAGLLRALEQGRQEVVEELTRGSTHLAASRAYAPVSDKAS